MTDRVPIEVLPNGAIRYGIYDAGGTFLRYEYIKCEDAAVILGTILNKANLLKDATAALYGLPATAVPNDVLTKLAGGVLFDSNYPTLLSSVSVGDVFYLNESGSSVAFIKLKTNYEGSGRTLVVRKDLYNTQVWDAENINAYSGSDIDIFLEGAYLALLDSSIQSSVNNVTIPYTPGDGITTLSTLDRKIFLLSFTELGLSNENANVEGTALPYFSSDSLRVATLSSVATQYWTRSPYTPAISYAANIGANGAYIATVTHASWGCRPAFTLPNDCVIAEDPSITDILGNPIKIPSAQLDSRTQIATGSYTGTGTFGSGGATVITLPFVPKVFAISISSGGARFVCFPLQGNSYGFSNTQNFSNTTALAFYGVNCALSGTTISLTSSASAAYQMNNTSNTYNYVAIG